MKLGIGVLPDDAPNSIARRIATMREHLASAAERAGRSARDVTLIGVTKKQPRAVVDEALASGLEDVAENYLQEARAKYAGVTGVRKHFIGHIQTNKAKAIVETFDVVQSIDRIDAGRAIARASRALGKPVTALLQVNVSPVDRFGIAPADAVELARTLREDEGLDIAGVMAIGPNTDDRAEIAAAFRVAARTHAEIGGAMLSIGMSADYEEAIASGSTMVRIGTALFGSRTNDGGDAR
ncbi:MAG: YggS family pyridoxal phosphate-dependent enzyme [Vulcanimicrobiaceae bacterium]